MKRAKLMTVIILTAAVCLAAASCSAGSDIFSLCGEDIKAWAADFDPGEYYNVSIEYSGESYVFHDYDFETPETIFNALKDVRVGEEKHLDGSEGPKAVITFRPNDGDPIIFDFAGSYIIPGDADTGYRCDGLDKLPVFGGNIPDNIVE